MMVLMMMMMMMEAMMITTTTTMTPWRKTQLCLHSVAVSLSVGEWPAKRKTRG